MGIVTREYRRQTANLLMILGTQPVHCLDHAPGMLRTDFGVYTVTQVEHVTTAMSELPQYPRNFGLYDRR